MTIGEEQLAELIRKRLASYHETKHTVGLGVVAVVDGTEAMIFGGRRSSEQPTAPDKNTLFEIGSITKVFTTTLLADMHLAGEVNLDDPVNRFLPAHARLVCRGGDNVTLRHLATHTSGLPRLPPNLRWEKIASDNPYADYVADDLYTGLARCRLKNRPGTRTRYSNLGSGLLGHVLSLVGGDDYEQLVRARLLQPLGMLDTGIQLSDEQQQRLAPGHSEGKPVRNWDFQALAGAGALRSTTADMLCFLRANIDPASTSLCRTIELTHELQTQFTWKWYRDFGCLAPLVLIISSGLLAWRSFGLPLWLRIAMPIAIPVAMIPLWQFGVIGGLDDMALGWHFDRLDNDDAKPDQWAHWHNGATDGSCSYLAFSSQHHTGVVLLANSDQAPDATGRKLLQDLIALRTSRDVAASAARHGLL